MTTYYDSVDDSKTALRNSLSDFPELPSPGYVSVGELNGQFQFAHFMIPEKYSQGCESVFNIYTENYIQLSKVIIHPVQTRRIPLIKTTAQDQFLLQSNEYGLKSIWTAWMDNGLVGSIDALRNLGIPDSIISLLRGIITTSEMIKNSKRVVKTLFFPHLALPNYQMIETYAPIRDWSTSWVRAMSWHPRLPRLAIAFKDDSVKILVNEHTPTMLPVLKAPEQKGVSCIAWHPYVNEFILGVESGFIIWTLYTPWKEKQKIPSSEFISTLPTGHAPVTSVDYCHNGQKILTSSAADTSIIIWSFCNQNQVPLYRLAGGGVPRAAWSPNSSNQIFSNTPGRYFRLWEYEDSVIKPKRWTAVKSRVEAFAWHPSGTFLFFVSDSLLFKLSLSLSGEHEVSPVFDLGIVSRPQDHCYDAQKVGGKVLHIEWDPAGKRLAVLFAESAYIAIFALLPGKSSWPVPCDFICGQEGEFPVAMTFQKDFKHGALLTIAWSTERIQYFPFLFSNIQVNHALNEECRIYSHPRSRGSKGGDFAYSPQINLESKTLETPNISQHFKLFSSDKLYE